MRSSTLPIASLSIVVLVSGLRSALALPPAGAVLGVAAQLLALRAVARPPDR